MHGSPKVALLQYTSGIIQVVNNVFENGITYFTSLIYTSIQFAMGSRDYTPFEGVSLTIYDELARWEKYVYGCNELGFNPLIY
ncbi:hypothetical protein Vi05172_g13734 [Venturia inaequalis]|nr:hypothetical protein Vi05172_g13734 [Venturia inaequalis]